MLGLLVIYFPCRKGAYPIRLVVWKVTLPHSPGDGARLDDGAAVERDGAVRGRAGETAVAVV